MQSPLISIITVVLNNAAGLRNTMASVAEQNITEIEHVVVDGGSTDGTIEILRADARGVRWISEKDSGIYNAMNKGIVMARGQYCLFLNAGDHLAGPDALARAMPRLDQVDLCYFDLEFREPSGAAGPAQWVKRYPDKLRFSHFISDTIPHPSCFIRRELFERYGYYDESMKIASDWKAFLLWICHHGCSYRHVPEVLSVFYTDGVSSRPDLKAAQMAERNAVLRAHFDVFLDDMLEYRDVERPIELIQALRRSRVVRILQSIGLLWKF